MINGHFIDFIVLRTLEESNLIRIVFAANEIPSRGGVGKLTLLYTSNGKY